LRQQEIHAERDRKLEGVFRQEWSGAKELFLKVFDNPNAPTGVKINSYLYLSLAEDKRRNPYPWLQKAYTLDPYSKTVVKYICMSHLAALSRMSDADRQGSNGDEKRRSLIQILKASRPLFPPDDAWLRAVKGVVGRPSDVVVRR